MVGVPSCLLRLCGSGRAKRGLQHVYLFCKSVVALISAIICWLGVWEIWDLYLWEKTVLRDVLYVLCNSLLMMLCGTFLANCGIYEEESGDAAKEEEMQQAMMRAIEEETETEEEAREHAHIDAIVAERRNSISVERIPSPRTIAIAAAEGDAATFSPEHIELSPTSPEMRARHNETRDKDHTNGDEHSAALSTEALSRSSSRLSRNGSHGPPRRLSHVDLIRVRHSESYSQRCASLASQLCTCELFFKVYVASLLSLLASIGFWAGAYNLLLAFFLIVAAQHAALSYALNLIVGWLLMWMTGTLFEQAGLSEVAPPAGASPPAARSPSLVDGHGCSVAHAWSRGKVYMRAILAITGTMAFWLGASMLLEELSEVYYSATASGSSSSSEGSSGAVLHCNACTESTPTRNAVFILLGLLIFVVTDTMAVHAGIEESNQSAASDTNLNRSASVNPSLPADEHRLVSGLMDSSGGTAISRSSRCSRFLAHPVMRHVRALASLTGVMILWEGIWDAAFTAEAEQSGLPRMLIYTGVGLVGLMLTNSLFANSGVVPPFALAKRSQQVQQRLGAHLEEKKIERAAAGGYAHPEEAATHWQLQRQQQQLSRQLESQMNQSLGALPDESGLSPSPPPFNALRSDSSGSDRSPRSSVGVPSPVPTPPTDSNGTLDSKVAFTQLQD